MRWEKPNNTKSSLETRIKPGQVTSPSQNTQTDPGESLRIGHVSAPQTSPLHSEVKQGGRGSFYPRGKKPVIVDTRWKHTISEQTLVVGVCGELSSAPLTVNLSCLSHPFDQPGEHNLQSGLGLLFNFKGFNMSLFGSFSLSLITEVFAQLHLFRNKWQLSLLKQSRANK